MATGRFLDSCIRDSVEGSLFRASSSSAGVAYTQHWVATKTNQNELAQEGRNAGAHLGESQTVILLQDSL